MSEVLRLKDIEKSFPGVRVLHDMNFELKSGEIHAICGENGAGKSTMMKIVTGVYTADSGEVIVDGETMHFQDPNDAYAAGIAIIYQETSLFEEMSILENIFLNHELTKRKAGITVIDYGAMRNDAERIFRQMNVQIDVDEKVKNLGMAQKQMVEIAKALTFQSKILILDEPTASLTQREVDALFEIMKNLKAQDVGIVYISHRLEEIFQICDRVTVIRDGKFISCHPVGETTKDQLVADMVGRSMDNYYPKYDVQVGDEVFRVEGLCQGDVLKNIDFQIKKGEIVGFSGLAGAGRTELAETLCGFRKADCGKVFLEGREIHIHNYREAMDEGIVYVSEDRGKYGLVTEMSIKDNVVMPQLQKMKKGLFIDKKKEQEIADKFIKDFCIKCPDSDFLVENLSGGNQQKVSVSKALALEPKLIILDEPTRGVDVNAKSEIHGIISKLVAKGMTIMMISSEMPELIGMCDRMYIMKNGTIAGEIDREGFSQKRILSVALDVNRGGER